MGIRFGFDEDKLTAVLVGEIDHHTAARLREEIDRKVGQMKPKELKLDFSQITFMDSSGIGLMMGRYRLMESPPWLPKYLESFSANGTDCFPFGNQSACEHPTGSFR